MLLLAEVLNKFTVKSPAESKLTKDAFGNTIWEFILSSVELSSSDSMVELYLTVI